MHNKIAPLGLAVLAAAALVFSAAVPSTFADRDDEKSREKSEVRIKGNEVRIKAQPGEKIDFPIEDVRGGTPETLRILSSSHIRITGGRLETAVAPGAESLSVSAFGLKFSVKTKGARIVERAGTPASLSDFAAGDTLAIEGTFDRASSSVTASKIVNHSLADRISGSVNERIRTILEQIRALEEQLRLIRQRLSDTAAPAISGIAAANVSSSGADLRWTTSEAATSRVYYASSSPLDLSSARTVFTSSLVTGHSLTLEGLAASTTYRFIVESKDEAGNTARSTEQSITTL